MNISRKDFIGSMFAAGALPLVGGCKSPMTVETMYNVSLSIGFTSGVIANQIKIEPDVRNSVIEILNIVHSTMPKVDETFEQAWMPIAERHIQLLVEAKKLTEKEGELVKAVFTVIVKGIDYVFIRYPKAKEISELVKAAADGFCTGFLQEFKPENEKVLGAARGSFDMEAYHYIKRAAKVR